MKNKNSKLNIKKPKNKISTTKHNIKPKIKLNKIKTIIYSLKNIIAYIILNNLNL